MFIKRFLVLSCLVVGLLTVSLHYTQAANLILNSDFESDSNNDGIPDNWRKQVGDLNVEGERDFVPGVEQAVMVLDRDVFYQGKISIKTASKEKAILGWAQKVKIKGGEKYKFSIWCKCKDLVRYGEGAAIQFIFDKGGKDKFQYLDLNMLSGSQDWVKAGRLLKAPPEATELTICLFGLFNGAGTTWLDEVTLASETKVEELVKNGEFEDKLKGWQTFQGPRANPVKVSIDQKIKKSGKASCKFEAADDGYGGIQQTFPVKPGQTYAFSLNYKMQEMKGHTKESVTALVQYSNGKRHFIDMGILKGDQDWKKVKKTYQIPGDVTSVLIKLFMYHSSGQVWLDEVSFAKPGAKRASVPWKPGTKDIIICSDVRQYKVVSDGRAKVTSEVSHKFLQPNGNPSLLLKVDYQNAWESVSVYPQGSVTINQPGGRIQLWMRAVPWVPKKSQTGVDVKVIAVFRDLEGLEKQEVICKHVGGDWRESRIYLSVDETKPGLRNELEYPVKLDRMVFYGRTGGHAEFCIGEAKVGMSGIYFKYPAYDTAQISSDLVSTPLFFVLDWGFGDRKKYPKNIEIVLELPESVKLAGWQTLHWGNTTQMCKIREEKCKRDSRDYARHIITYPTTRHTIAHSNYQGMKRIFYYLRTSQESGQVDAYYYLRYAGYTETARRLPLEAVRIKQLLYPPKMLLVTMSIKPEWPGLLENLQRLGFNGLEVGVKQAREISVNEARKKGFFTQTQSPHWGMLKLLVDSGAPKKTVLEGTDNTYTRGKPCLTRADKAVKKVGSSYTPFVDNGFTCFFFDDEYWDNVACYCPDCMAGFRRMKKERRPDLPDTSPLEFAMTYKKAKAQGKKPDKVTSELYDLWADYHYVQYNRIGKLIRQEVQKYARKKGINPDDIIFFDTWGQSVRNNYTARKAVGAFDLQSIGGFYGQDPLSDGKRLSEYEKWFEGTSIRHYPALSAGLYYCDLRELELHNIIKWKFLEAFAAGVEGIYMYNYNDIDTLDMKYMSEAIWTVLPVEDIVVRGKPYQKVQITEGEGNLRARKLDNELLILVSEYKGKDSRELVIDTGTEITGPVWNLNTRRKIGETSSFRSTFKAKLTPQERAVMYYIGKKEISGGE